MVIVLVVATVTLVLVAELIRRRVHPAARVPETLAATRAAHARFPRVRWLSAGHVWVETHGPREARIGVTDLAARLLGTIDAVEGPRPGDRIRQGEPFVGLRHGRRRLSIPAPLTGVVVETNRALDADPGLLGAAPYDRGFLARIVPAAPRIELRSLMRGTAAERWEDSQRMELARWFAPQVGLVAADGGVPTAVADLLDDDDWERLVETFFPEPLRDEATSPDKE